MWRDLARVALLSSVPLLAIALDGCGSKSPTTPNPLTTGTLIVTVPPPTGTTAFAAVGGPGNYAVFVTGTDTLTGLAAGTYTLSDAVATLNAPIVTPFYASTIIGSPITITVADTGRMSATFGLLPGTGQLWVGSTNGGSSVVAAYTSTQLTTDAPAGLTLSVAGSYALFDATSNLWVADSSTNTIVEYPAAVLGASGTPTPAVSITSSALSGPVGLAFDRLGDLWVANTGANTVVEFTAAQLAAGGSLTPSTTLSSSALNGPGRISFDAYGNLWVPNTGSNTVVAFSPSQLVKDSAGAVMITLSANGASLAGPAAVAFDEQGDLWVANAAGNTIVAFANVAQTTSGSPTPALTFVVPVASGGPATLAFDNSGDLWAISATSSSVIEYTAQQIAAYGASAPALTMQVANGPVSLAFDPPPNGIPVVGPQIRRVTSSRQPLVTRRRR